MVCSNNRINDAAGKKWDRSICTDKKKSLSFKYKNRYTVGYILRMAEGKG